MENDRLTMTDRKVFSLRIAAVFILSFAMTACVGNRQARDLASSLSATSAVAKTQVEILEKTSEAQVNAHKLTRATLKQLTDERQELFKQAAISDIRDAYRQSLASVDRDYLSSLDSVRNGRSKANDALESAILRELQPLQQKALALEEIANQRAKEESEAPASLKLQSRRRQADAQYLAAFAAYSELYITARTRGESDLGAAAEQAISDLDNLRLNHRSALDRIYQREMKVIQSSQLPKISLGPDPVTPSGYTELMFYLDQVGRSGQSLEGYFTANSFGPDSFFGSFFKSLGSGVIAGVTGADSSAVTIEDVRAAGADVLQPLAASARERLGEAANTARNSMTETAVGLVDGLAAEASDSIRGIAQERKIPDSGSKNRGD